MPERKATVLIVDAPSDRRSAAVMAHAKSPHVGKILVTSGAGLLSHNCPDLPKDAIEISPVHHTDVANILKLAEEKKPDLIEVGQEDAIYAGVTDILRKHGFLTFGVSRKAGKYEWDKVYARRTMLKYGAVDCLPNFRIFKKHNAGLAYIEDKFSDEDFKRKLFIKAAYPALGKGVFGVENVSEAYDALIKLILLPNRAGRIFLVEDGVGGSKAEEFSGYFLGNNLADFGYYQDHKQVDNNNMGPNTGGMGSVGPISLITSELNIRIKQEMIRPFSQSLKDQNLKYQGFLYVGGMYDPETKQIWNIEFNCRNGGSEAASNMPGIENDYYELIRSVAEGSDKTTPLSITHDGKIRVAVAGTSLGYPEDYKRVIGRKVQGLQEIIKRGEVLVLGAGIEDDFTVTGGRIFWLVATADNVQQAVKTVYRNMENLYIPGDERGENLLHFRSDIADKELRRLIFWV